MNRKFYISFLLIIVSLISVRGVNAQQLPYYNHYFINPYLYNPSAAGFNGLNALMIHKSQWSAIPGAPVINTLAADGPFMKNRAGLGLMISDDKRGITKRTDIAASFSYKVKLTEDADLSFGASGTYINTRLLFNEVIVSHQDDPMVLGINAQRGVFDATAGLMFFHRNFQIGLAIPQALAAKAEFSDSRTNSFYQYNRYYLASTSYKFMLVPEKEITLTPLAMTRLVPGMPVQYDFNITADWKKAGWLGISYRRTFGAGVSAGVRIAEKLNIGYSYDINTGPGSAFVGMSHEFILGYRFNSESKRANIKGHAGTHNEIKKEIQEQRSYLFQLIDGFFSKESASKKEVKKEIERIYNELKILRKMEKKDKSSKKKSEDTRYNN